ncbi:MAG TPA: UV DNA damage repair endonuclease UvsE [Candidatus Melainabacteria bacterium]|nr:UV DNA damage repair endonuclease UvsE [Candidatus Melainabacteria bacterium]
MPRKKQIVESRTGSPQLGLVCVSFSEEIRYRTITRTRYLSLSEVERLRNLSSIYADNIETLGRALQFCNDRQIRLYRMPSSIFPFADTAEGLGVLQKFAARLAEHGETAKKLAIRIVAHPDQFVVLSSDSQQIIDNSITVLQMHADIFDMMGLSRSPYNAIIIHGGKRGNDEILKRTIAGLPETIRSRLTLENDEISYSSNTILSICCETGLSMIFDAHHHLIMEKCRDYTDPRIREAMEAARSTWHPNEEWQLVHISNGTTGLHDRRHSDFIDVMPDCFADVGWIEIEARGKEAAIEKIRSFWPPAKAVSRA